MNNKIDLIPRTHFETSSLRPQDRYEAWSDSISVIFDVAPTEHTMLEPFAADIESYMIGSMMAAVCTSKTQEFSRSNATIARDGMDHVLLQFYLVGGNTIRTPSGHIHTKPGDIQIIDMAQEIHTTTYFNDHLSNTDDATNYRNVSLFIARDRLEDLVPSVHALHLRIIPANTPLNAILRNYITSMYQNGPNLTNTEADALVQPTAELLAASLGKLPDTVALAENTINQAVLLSVKKFIRQQLHNPALTPDLIAQYIGISRASLFRLCKPLGGIKNFIQQQRIIYARRLLNNPNTTKSVKSIAYNLGFNSPSSFTRAYKQHFGFTPTETRDLFIETMRTNTQTRFRSDNGVDRRYEYWMANLVA